MSSKLLPQIFAQALGTFLENWDELNPLDGLQQIGTATVGKSESQCTN